MIEELAYSIHLGADRNKSARAKEIAKKNPSNTTSSSNNGIQNATQLSKVNKHNLRDYDNKKDKIYTIYGTDNLYRDIQQLYLQEIEQSRIEYNNKQTREDRKIQNYFKHISDSKLWDLCCEFIIEIGDMEFWNGKNDEYRIKMIDVFKEQIEDLQRIVPAFKIANATSYFDEVSPHIHIVGVPVSDDNASNDVTIILDTLKPSKLNKNNMLISSENVEIIKNYTKDVKDTTKTIRNVNDLNIAIRDFEHSAFEVQQENSSLKYELELKDEEIGRLKSAISKKDKIIDKIQTEKESLKQQLQKFKGFWHKTIKYFQDKINYNGDKNFIEVAKDLFINKIFDSHEYEIVTDRRKKVKTTDEVEAFKWKNKNNKELK